MTNVIRIRPDEDKLQKYRDYYAGAAELDEEEKKYLDRYERVMLLFEQNEADEEQPVWTRSAIVKFVREHYKVSVQMSNRIVNEALELFGDMQQLSLRARKSFRLQHLDRREKDAVAYGDLMAAARLNDQINKILGTYKEELTTEEDETDYSVPTTINYEPIDVPYELIPDHPPQPVANRIPQSTAKN